MSLKRKRSSIAQVYDCIGAAENRQPFEEVGMPMRKRKRTDSFGILPSHHDREWSSSSDQTTASINEKNAEDLNSLRDSACAVGDGLREPLSSVLEAVPPADPQVQTPPVSIHYSPAPDHGEDDTTEDIILSRYEIGEMLGEGGFGSVYEGIRLEDGLEVAVKFVQKTESTEFINIPGDPTLLPQEVALLTLVNRGPKVPEIIELLDWEDQPDQYIMVLERPSHCKDLFEFLEDHGDKLSEETARRIISQAVKAAHMSCRRGVFHSDIKLENLLINTETLEVKLIDFGCGSFLQDSAYDVFYGTKVYCPPEFFTDGAYHAKPATVWSLGVVLFELLCGHLPDDADLDMIEDDIWSEPGLSKECRHLIRSLLRNNPSQRIGLRRILFHKWFKQPVSQGSDSQLHRHPSSSSGQGQKVEDLTTAATSEIERHAEGESKRTSSTIGQKRKRSSRSAPLYDEAETRQHFHVGDEDERPMKKKKRTDSFEKQPSLHHL